MKTNQSPAFLTYSEWQFENPAKLVKPAFRSSSPRACGAVNVGRCLAIAFSKNAKIQAVQSEQYRAYVSQWEAENGPLSSLPADTLKEISHWIVMERGRDAAIQIMRESGHFTETTPGKFSSK